MINLRFILVIFIAMFSALSNTFAFEGKLQKIVLDNGLTIIVSEMPQSPVVCLYGLIKAGSATEGNYLGSGISHFLEHMVFKGTEKHKVGEIAALIQSIGGEINASTGKDHTIFTISVPFKEFDTALDVLADILANSTFDSEELEKERKVVFGEMRLYKDNPDRYLSELTYQQSYLTHPYKHPIIGYESIFAKVTRDNVVDYYRKFYIPNNMIISIGGNVKIDEVMPKIKKAFEGYERKSEVLRNLVPEPAQISAKRYEENYPTKLTRFSLTFKGVSILEKDMFALDVLAQVLGQGNSSYLYQNIYKKGLVYEVGSYNYTPVDQGLFGISATLEGSKLDQSLKAVWQEIENIQKKGITLKDLTKAKNQVLSGYVFNHQSASSVTYAQAVDEAFTGDYHFSKKYIDGINRVQIKDVTRVAQEYLKENRATLTVLHSEDHVALGQALTEQINVGEIEKIKLDNGVTLLLKEDHSYPMAVIRASFQGGLRQENLENQGISKLMMALLFKGTKSFPEKKFNEYVESLGMEASGFSGKNSFGLNISVLSKDLDKGIVLLEELIKYPTFPEDQLAQLKDDAKAVIVRKKDNISSFTSQALKQKLFGSHPLGMDEDGSLESIERISRDEIVSLYKEFTVPSNMVISIFGDFQRDEILKLVKSKFKKMPEQAIDSKVQSLEAVSQKIEETLRLNKQQAMVMFGFQGPTLLSRERPGVEVMTAILGSSFSGRLFNHVREKLGQAYTLGGNYIPSLDAGMIYFYVLTTDDKVETVKSLVQDEIQKLASSLVDQEELQNVKNYLKGNFENELETNSSLSFTVSLDELYGLGFENYKKYNEDIDKISVEDIKALAEQYLNLNKAVVVITRPELETIKQ